MDISIIIVAWNVQKLLKKCLNSVILSGAKNLEEKPRDPSASPQDDDKFEIIVVDNGSTDGTVAMLRQNFSVIPAKAGIQSSANGLDSGSGAGMTIKLIQNSNNRGFAAANNQGIRQAKGRYILLLNPDTEFIEYSLSKVVAKMESDERIGVLGCQLLNPDGSIQLSVRRFPTVWSQLIILIKLRHLWPSLLNKYLMKGFDYSREQEVDQIMGAFFCARREVFDKIGLLDEGYFIWFEEVDFCRRAKKAGYKVVYWPGTQVLHHGGQSFKQQMTIKKQWWFFKSAVRYFSKSHGFVK